MTHFCVWFNRLCIAREPMVALWRIFLHFNTTLSTRRSTKVKKKCFKAVIFWKFNMRYAGRRTEIEILWCVIWHRKIQKFWGHSIRRRNWYSDKYQTLILTKFFRFQTSHKPTAYKSFGCSLSTTKPGFYNSNCSHKKKPLQVNKQATINFHSSSNLM